MQGNTMNERIKELYSEAALYAFNQRFIPGVVRELQEVITEKFAELIVKECADYVQFYYKDHACEVIAHDMKTHFGVEL
jgi:hypothetical protein